MGYNIQYAKLFEVNILHHYFLNRGSDVFANLSVQDQEVIMLQYDLRNIFNITPTPACKEAIKGHKCVFRQTAQGFFIGLPVEKHIIGNQSLFSPLIPIDDQQEFTFNTELKDSGFLNYTALPLQTEQNRVYLFDNNSVNGPKSFPFLNTIPPVFNAEQEYYPGDMLSNHPTLQTSLFTALLKTKTTPGTLPNWLTENAGDGAHLQFANIKDRCIIARRNLLYQVKAEDLEPDVTLTNAAGEQITVKKDYFPGKNINVQLNLQQLPEGIYTAHFHSTTQAYDDTVRFFLMQQNTSPFAVFNLSVKSDLQDYDFFNAQGMLRSPLFQLHFRNRMTHWRYVGKKFNQNSYTGNPLPLTQNGFIDDVKVKDINGEDVDDLPNAGTTPIKAEAYSDDEETRFYSDIHIN